MRFAKMHGIGNDFVVVDGSAERIPAEAGALARRVCDRHTGIGADGLLVILPPEPGVEADLRMRVWNADGGESEMCGNGIRCVCKLVHDRGLCRKNPMRIQTGRGVLELVHAAGADGQVATVTVAMGEPVLAGAPTRPMPGPFPGGSEWRAAAGVGEEVTYVSMGNPHAVVWCKDVARVPLETVGPALGTLLAPATRTNVHFAQVLDPGAARVRTWERGSGITLACGTGASAVCVAGVLTGRTGRRLRAHLPGGDLELDWSEKDNQVRMTGPAVLSYTGEWPD